MENSNGRFSHFRANFFSLVCPGRRIPHVSASPPAYHYSYLSRYALSPFTGLLAIDMMYGMNEIIQSLFKRKSVRQFLERQVSPEEKTLILQSALQAPTAGNQNLYTILDITDADLKRSLSVYCDNQPFIASAPLALLFLADCRRWYDSYLAAGIKARPPENGDLLLAVADAVIAAQNTVVAAESLGIGSCYIGDILEQEEKIREVLGLDEYVFPAAFVVYGFPAKGQIEDKTGQAAAFIYRAGKPLPPLKRKRTQADVS